MKKKYTLMLLQLRKKIKFSLSAFIFYASFLFLLLVSSFLNTNKVVAAENDINEYKKNIYGTLTHNNWNNLFKDFVNTWLPTSLLGPMTIGTTTPPAIDRLLVLGNIAGNTALEITNSSSSSFISGRFGVGNAGSGTSKLAVFGNQSIGTGYYSSQAPDDGLIVAGKVGIGTTGPRSKLEVNGDILIPNDNSLLSRDAGNNVSVPLFKFDSGNALTIGTWEGSYVGNTYIKGGNGNVFVDFSQGNNANFIVRKVSGVTPTELMRVTTAGNVGIGTIDPTSQLDILSNKVISGGLSLRVLVDAANKQGYFGVDGSGAGGTPDKIYFGGSGASDDGFVGSRVNLNFATNYQTRLTILQAGNVGVGTTTPLSTLHVNGNILTTGLSFSGDPSDVKFSWPEIVAAGGGDQWTSNGNDIYNTKYNTTGKVGIGTATPIGRLDVAGAGGLVVTSANLDPNYSNVYNLNSLKNSGKILIGWNYGGGIGENDIISNRGAGSGGGFRFYDYSNDGVMSNLMTLQGDGKVGIGTINPVKKLEIIGAAPAVLGIGTHNTREWDITAKAYNSTKTKYDLDISPSSYSGDLTLITNGQLGNVGIGTTTPAVKLEVLGSIIANGSISATGFCLGADCKIKWSDIVAAGGGDQWTSNGNDIYNTKYNTNGKVGIGLTNPSEKLVIVGGLYASDGFKVASSTAANWIYGRLGVGNGSAGTSKLAVFGNQSIGTGYYSFQAPDDGLIVQGDVGIGTSSPISKLDVVGSSGDTYITVQQNSGGGAGLRFLRNPTGYDNGFKNNAGIFYITTSQNNFTSENNRMAVDYNGNVGIGGDITAGLDFTGASMVIKSGNVGIGTTDPTTLLQIKNNNWISAKNFAGTGAINMFKVNANNQIEVGAPLNIGSFEFSPDSGLVTFADMPVTSAPAIGTPEGYVFKVDGDNILSIYSEANGSGGIQNKAVGIGTTSPKTRLAVDGGSGDTVNVGGGRIINLNTTPINASEAVPLSYLQNNYTSSTTADVASLWSGTKNGDIWNGATGTGRVGIGTTAPGAPLEISNSTSNGDSGILKVTGTGAITNANIGFQTVGGTSLFQLDYAGNMVFRTPQGGMYFDNRGSGDILFRTTSGNSNRLIIKNAGNVGIGSTSPNVKLVINGGDTATGDVVNVGGGRIINLNTTPINASEAVPLSYLQNNYTSSTTADVASLWSGTKNGNIWNGASGVGKVGIGTSEPSNIVHINDVLYDNYALRVQGSTHNTLGRWTGIGLSGETLNTKAAILFQSIGSSYSRGSMIFAVNNSADQTNASPVDAVMTLTPSGRVGIGTTEPSGILHVSNVLSAKALIVTDSGKAGFGMDPNINFQTSFAGGFWAGGESKAISVTASRGPADYSSAKLATTGTNPVYGNLRLMANGDTKVYFDANSVYNYIDSGNVGIGTTSPNTKLYVNGGAGNVINVGGGRIINLNTTPINASEAVPLSYLQNNYTSSTTADVASLWSGTKNGNIWNGATGTGRVGIGTTAPGVKLDINGAVRTNNQLISTVAQGTAPLAVTSNTLISNLNADLLDGKDYTYFARDVNPVGEVVQVSYGRNNTLIDAAALDAKFISASRFFPPSAVDIEASVDGVNWIDAGWTDIQKAKLFDDISYSDNQIPHDTHLRISINYTTAHILGTFNYLILTPASGGYTFDLKVTKVNKTNNYSDEVVNSVGLRPSTFNKAYHIANLGSVIFQPNANNSYFDKLVIEIYAYTDKPATYPYLYLKGVSLISNDTNRPKYPYTWDYEKNIIFSNGMKSLGNSVNYFSGNVGIGSTSPNVKLVIDGGATATGDVVNVGGGRIINLNTTPINASEAVPLSYLQNNYTSSTTADVASLWSGTKNGDIWNGATGTGRVGIGTTAPSYPLDVYNSGAGGGFALNLKSNGNTYRPGIRMEALRPTVAGVAFPIFDLNMGNLVSNRVGQIGAYGQVATDPGTVLRYIYLDARNTASYDNATLKIDNNNRVGIGLTSITRPLSTLDVLGGVSIGSYAGVSAAPSNGMIIDGNVGIGTTNPVNKFSVVGNADFSGNVGFGVTSPDGRLHLASDDYKDIFILERTNPTYAAKWEVGLANGRWNQAIYPASEPSNRKLMVDPSGTVSLGVGPGVTTWSAPSNSLLVKGRVLIGEDNHNPLASLDVRGSALISGNVGIGSTSPNVKLVINGGDTATGDVVNVGGGRIINLNTTPINASEAVPLSYLQNNYTSSTTADVASLWSGTKNGNIWNGATGTGRVGIGTTAPNSKLNAIDGTVSEIRFNSGAASLTPTLAVGNLNASGKFAALIAGTSGAGFYYDDSGSFSITASAKSTYTGNSMGASGVHRLWINSSGNVGIGTASPGYKLDVAGAIAVHDENQDIDSRYYGGTFLRGWNSFSSGSEANISYITDTTSPVGNQVLQVSSSVWARGPKIPLDITQNYEVEMWVKRETANTFGQYYFVVSNYDYAGSIIGGDGTDWSYPISLNQNSMVVGTWYKYRFVMGPYLGLKNHNPNAKFISVGFIANLSGGTDVMRLTGFKIRPIPRYNNDSLTITNSGNVGIGTTNPTSTLHVNGGVGNVINVGGGRIINLNTTPINASEAVPLSYLQNNYTSSTTADVASLWSGTKNGNIWNGATGTGRVGIGTTAPYIPLTISGTAVGAPFTGLSIINSTPYGAGTGLPTARIVFNHNTAGGTASGELAYIEGGNKIETQAINGYLALGTRRSDVLTEAMRIDNLGNVGIGTTNPTSTLHVNGGAGNVINVGGGKIFGLHSTPYDDTEAVPLGYLKANYTSSTTADVASLWSGTKNGNIWNGATGTGRVGIGTSSPFAKFQVFGGAAFGDGSQTSFLSGSDFQIQKNSNNNTVIGMWQNGVASSLIGSKANDSNFYLTNNYYGVGIGAASTSLAITASGRFGIGSTSPNVKLVIDGGATATGDVVNVGGGRIINLNTTPINASEAVPLSYLQNNYTSSTTADVASLWSGTKNGNIWNGATGTGRVGIGTITPASKLQVNDTLTTGQSYFMVSNNDTELLSIRNWVGSFPEIYSPQSIYIKSGSTGTGSVIYKSGTFQLENPTGLFRAYGGTLEFKTSGGSLHDIFFSPNDTEAMRILGNGNVGIGTTDPGTALSFKIDTGNKIDIANGQIIGLNTTPSSSTSAVSRLYVHNNFAAKYKQHRSVNNADYTATDEDYIIGYSAITANRTVTLPNTLCTPGRFFVVLDESGQAGIGKTIIIDPEDSTPILGVPTFNLNAPYNAVYVFCGNNAWFIL